MTNEEATEILGQFPTKDISRDQSEAISKGIDALIAIEKIVNICDHV